MAHKLTLPQIIPGLDNYVGAFLLIFSLIVTSIVYIILKQALGQIRSRQQVHEDYVEIINDVRHQIRPTDGSLNGTPGLTAEEATYNDNCPICLERVTYALSTNCGHLFCGSCFLFYMERTRSSAVPCPICRRTVTLLMTQFTGAERHSQNDQKQRIIRSINTYNMRFSGRPVPWSIWLNDLPTLMYHMIVDFFTIGGIQMVYRLRLFVCFIIAMIYLLSPLDLIPESAFGILGMLDDVMVIIILLMYCTAIYRIAVQNRH